VFSFRCEASDEGALKLPIVHSSVERSGDRATGRPDAC